MRRRSPAALLPPDRGLQARMLLAMLLAPAIALGGAGVAVAVPATRIAVIVVVAIGILRLSMADAEPRSRMVTPALPPDDLPHVHAVVDRLCLLADLPKPEIVVEWEDQPNSWIEAPGGAPARLHLTLGLLLLLEPDELEAVIGHELAHLAHHDARVMGVVGGSGELLLNGAEGVTGFWMVLWPGTAAAALGGISRLTTCMLARHRELVADAGSAALTGRPAALASALRRISGELARVPAADPRAAGARDVLHLLPLGDELSKSAPLRTHPLLDRRIERLERLERGLHAARPAPPHGGRGRPGL